MHLLYIIVFRVYEIHWYNHQMINNFQSIDKSFGIISTNIILDIHAIKSAKWYQTKGDK